MNTKRISVLHAQIIAHRGCSCLEKENTMAAFIAAGNRSYFGIETDVHKTSDGQFVILHDDNTWRVAGGDSVDVEKTSMANLRRITLCDIDGSHTREDLHLPTLDEYLNACRRYEKVGVLEIKSEFSVEDMDAVMEKIGGYADRMIIISFHMASLLHLRVHHPNQRAQFLCGSLSDEELDILQKNRFGIDIIYTNMNEALLAKCRERGIETNVWTVDDPAEAERLDRMGVDFITSNWCEAR